MSTPKYEGQGQPTADVGSGWLGRFGSFLGGSASPTYQSVPVKSPEEKPETPAEMSRCGPIAIIVPRQGCVAAAPTEAEPETELEA